MRKEFQVHMLNEVGKEKAAKLAEAFSDLLDTVESICGWDGRDVALVRTKLEEASFFAKRAMASYKAHQQ